MIILVQLILVFLQPAQANYLDYVFNTEPEILVQRDDKRDISLNSVCAEMKYNYLEEMTKFHKLKAEIDRSVQQPVTDQQVAQIEVLKSHLQQATNHLIFLAKPEWNSEILTFALRWWLPAEFNDDNVDLDSIEVRNLYYKSERAGYLAPRLRIDDLGWPWGPSSSAPRRYYEFRSRGTYLELCQFASTLEFEVKLKYFWYNFLHPRLDDALRASIIKNRRTDGLKHWIDNDFKDEPAEKMFFLKGRTP